MALLPRPPPRRRRRALRQTTCQKLQLFYPQPKTLATQSGMKIRKHPKTFFSQMRHFGGSRIPARQILGCLTSELDFFSWIFVMQEAHPKKSSGQLEKKRIGVTTLQFKGGGGHKSLKSLKYTSKQLQLISPLHLLGTLTYQKSQRSCNQTLFLSQDANEGS